MFSWPPLQVVKGAHSVLVAFRSSEYAEALEESSVLVIFHVDVSEKMGVPPVFIHL